MSKTRVNVSLAIPEAARFEGVIAAAEALGFRSDALFPKLGVATGSVPQEKLELVRALNGIAAVELQNIFRAVSS